MSTWRSSTEHAQENSLLTRLKNIINADAVSIVEQTLEEPAYTPKTFPSADRVAALKYAMDLLRNSQDAFVLVDDGDATTSAERRLAKKKLDEARETKIEAASALAAVPDMTKEIGWVAFLAAMVRVMKARVGLDVEIGRAKEEGLLETEILG